MAPSEPRPVGLRCEYRVDPLGIGERVPRLSWTLESEERGQVQSAFRVLVARSEKDLEAEENLLWDSGRGESYDARREMPGWAESGFDDSGWYGVEVEEIGDTNLVAQPDEGIRVTEELEAKTVTEPESGRYVLDLGRNMVGWVRLKVEGEAGTEVTLCHAEALNPDGTIYTTNLRSARATDSYVLGGDVSEGGRPVDEADGVEFLRAEEGETVLAVGSGRYEFVGKVVRG
jgi:Bacterial alpha-L-rhamnosidase concanavalin-like domain/Alpha-L-rhamnosidase N-terminal domain